MPGKNRAAVIEDPAGYLKTTYRGRGARLLRSACIEESKVPAYLIQDYNACCVYGTACLVAFASGKGRALRPVVGMCKKIAEDGYSKMAGGSEDYYTKLGKEAPFVRKCLRTARSGYSARSSLFVKRRALDEIGKGRPVLLNIGLSGQYRDHTVTAYGYEEYAVGPRGKKMLFFKVRDGYSKEDRYLLYRGILGISVTYLSMERR